LNGLDSKYQSFRRRQRRISSREYYNIVFGEHYSEKDKGDYKGKMLSKGEAQRLAKTIARDCGLGRVGSISKR